MIRVGTILQGFCRGIDSGEVVFTCTSPEELSKALGIN
jgi:hypothetical protein